MAPSCVVLAPGQASIVVCAVRAAGRVTREPAQRLRTTTILSSIFSIGLTKPPFLWNRGFNESYFQGRKWLRQQSFQCRRSFRGKGYKMKKECSIHQLYIFTLAMWNNSYLFIEWYNEILNDLYLDRWFWPNCTAMVTYLSTMSRLWTKKPNE